MRWTTPILAIYLVSPVVAQAEPATGFTLRARTAQVSYYSRHGARPDVKRSEVFLARLSEVFGEAPEGWHLDYYFHDAALTIASVGGAHAAGVTDLSAVRIDSTRPFHPHELVHAVAGRIGRCPVFFAEGIAVALTSQGRWGERPIDEVARTALATGTRLEPFLSAFTAQRPQESYPIAGSFVAFLLDRHGVDSFVTFLRGCGATPRRYEGVFRRAFGRSVANAIIAWKAALANGDNVAGWAWSDPESWPSSLRRGPSHADPPSVSRTASNDGGAEEAGVLLSVAH